MDEPLKYLCPGCMKATWSMDHVRVCYERSRLPKLRRGRPPKVEKDFHRKAKLVEQRLRAEVANRERRARVREIEELRKQGETFEDIAKRWGVSRQRVHQMFNEASRRDDHGR